MFPGEILNLHTVGWLLSQIKNKLRKRYGPTGSVCGQCTAGHIVGIKTRAGTELADYWLTQMDRMFTPVSQCARPLRLELVYSGMISPREFP